MLSAKQLRITGWALTVLVASLALLVWGEGINWRLGNLTAYQLFPLFGLLAFSLMWAHYIMAALRQQQKVAKPELKQYFEITSLLVLVFLLLHPGLLAWQLWQVGLGLPPGSYFQFAGGSLKVAIIAGLLAWVVFIIYELRRRFETRSWWQFVQIASDIAILLIFFHGLRLGGELQSGWFVGVWWFYGISLIGVLLYMYSKKLLPNKGAKL